MTENLSTFVADLIVGHAAPDSKQEKVVNLDIAYNTCGIVWLNKDGSYYTCLIEVNDKGEAQVSSWSQTAEQYEQTKHIF